MPERLTVSVAEAAELLGVGKSTLYELIRAGEFPALRIGHRLVIPRRALDELLELPSDALAGLVVTGAAE